MTLSLQAESAVTPLVQFAAESLRKRLRALVKEADGVRESADIEHVHRMRVASRRLNVALNVFAALFPPKPFKRWHRQIRALRKALADARDLDVQIAFLEAFCAKLTDEKILPGVVRLLLRKRQSRAKLQKRVVEALRKFEDASVVNERRAALHGLEEPDDASAVAESGDSVATTDSMEPSGEVLPAESRERVPPLIALAELQLQERAGELRELEECLRNVESTSAHHEMRIAAKHLRYTLELFAPLFADELKSRIEACKQAQELLGQLHDLDVWIETLPLFTQRETRRTAKYYGYDKPMQPLIPGLKALEEHCRRERSLIFEHLVEWWSSGGRAVVLNESMAVSSATQGI